MYENLSFNVLKERMLERIPNELDKREGSIIFNALAAVAVEFELSYRQLDRAINDCLPDTAEMEALKQIAKPFGISPKPATHAILGAMFEPGDIDVTGRRFTCGELSYVVTEWVQDSSYSLCKVQCEQAGRIGNKYQTATLVPIEAISGLSWAHLTEVITPGTEAEETEAFRSRFFTSAIAFGGNVADYKQKALTVPGVGGVRVMRDASSGDVLVYLQSVYFHKASDEVINAVADLFSSTNEGLGLAPIGHTVRVRSAVPTIVYTRYNLVMSSGYEASDALEEIKEKERLYYEELRKKWSDLDWSEGTVVSAESLRYIALGVKGVTEATVRVFLSDFAESDNICLQPEQIPVVGDE